MSMPELRVVRGPRQKTKPQKKPRQGGVLRVVRRINAAGVGKTSVRVEPPPRDCEADDAC